MSANLASSILSLVRLDVDASGAIDEVVPSGHHSMERVIALGQSMYVRGWAVDARAALLASQVVLVIDGVLGFPATYGHSRADIATVFGVPEYRRAGFDAVIPPVLGLGAHNVAACAISADGKSYSIVATADFHVIPSLIPRPFAAPPLESGTGEITGLSTDGDERTIEQRAGRSELAFDAGVTVNGWGALPSGAYDEVGVVVDNLWYVQGSRVNGARDGTYQTRFVLNFALPGDHEIYAVAKRGRSPFVRISNRIPFESIEPALPWIWALVELKQPTRAGIDTIFAAGESIAALPRGTAIFISGWAKDEPAGGPAGGVYISIDGDRRTAVPARYGRPTRDEIGTNCGFTAIVPTDSLVPGKHTLEVLVTAQSWSGYYVPLAPLEIFVTPKS